MLESLKPMRAYKLDDDKIDLLHYPILGSPKYDGIRAIVKDNIVLSNTLKPIRNRKVQEICAKMEYCDGELISGSNFQETTSCIMAESGGYDFTFYIFDSFKKPQDIYINRVKDIEEAFIEQNVDDGHIVMVQPVTLRTPKDVLLYEEWCLQKGFEGCMLRHPKGRYKFGRSTFNEQYLLKRKPVCDEEAFIVGFEEQEENLNELTYDNRGYAQRSMHQDNKAGKDTLGAFLVRSSKWGDFKIGTGLGLTNELRREIWLNRDKYLGRILTFKYQAFGSKDKPRQPIFLRFRHREDTLI